MCSTKHSEKVHQKKEDFMMLCIETRPINVKSCNKLSGALIINYRVLEFFKLIHNSVNLLLHIAQHMLATLIYTMELMRENQGRVFLVKDFSIIISPWRVFSRYLRCKKR